MAHLGAVVFFGFLAGIDNLQAACALGMLPRRRKWPVALSFGFCECLSSLAGLLAGSLLRIRIFGTGAQTGAIALMASGLVILYFGLRNRDASEVAESGWLVFGLPLSLSLDNLVSGAGLGAGGYPVFLSAAIIGVICTAMSLWGLFLGTWWRGLFPRRATVLSGAWLVLASVYSLVR